MSYDVKFLIPVIIAIIVFVFYFIKTSSRVINTVSLNWCKLPLKKFKFSYLFYLFAVSVLVLTLLDFRGASTYSEGNKAAAHTIILLDTSLSMLAEDLKPNRINAGIIHLKHFIKKSKGHIFELHVFSDNHKRVLAFTEDKNLLMTRLEALKSIGVIGGGSDITVSLKAALSSFKNNDISQGNILLITDSDLTELESFINKKEASKFNIAVLQASKNTTGSKIPLRTPDGRLKFNKRSNGKEVLSKPNEAFYKSLSSIFENSLKFEIDGFAFHTDRILRFFENTKSDQKEMLKFLSRPVYGPYLMLFAFILFIISYLLKLGRNFVELPIIILILGAGHVRADTIERLRLGRVQYEEIVNFTNSEIKKKKYDNALTLLEENIGRMNDQNIQDFYNLGSLYLQKGDIKKGILLYKNIQDLIKEKSGFEDLKSKMVNNILFVLNQEGSGKGKSKDNKSKQSKGDQDKDQSKSDKNDDNGDQEQKQQKKQVGKTEGLIQQILNDDKKSHEKYLKTELKKGQIRNGGNDW